MNKKICSILFLVLLLTGCKANYVLKYEDGKFSEHLELISNQETYKEDEAHPTYENLRNNDVTAVLDGSEKWILDSDSSQYDIKISHKLENTTLDDITIVNECFGNHTYKETDDLIYYEAFGTFYCDYLENGSTFTLETSAKVINHNATSKNGNSYTWNLDNKTVKEDGIFFQILKEEKETKKKKNTSADLIPWYIKLIISIIFITVIIWAVMFIRKRS